MEFSIGIIMKQLWSKINEQFSKFATKIRDTRRRGKRKGGNRTVTVDTPTYHSRSCDFYIGVASDRASTIYLPPAVRDGKIIVIKAEMRPPMGSRKINIATTDGSTIDGYSELSITVSHGAKFLIRNRNNWFIIN